MQGVSTTSRWFALAIGALTQAGCSFTNEFEVPAAVGDWRGTLVAVNDAGTERQRDILRIDENGKGEFLWFFDDDTFIKDTLRVDRFSFVWSLDAEEYFLQLTCEDTTGQVCADFATMACRLSSNREQLFCRVAPAGLSLDFDFVPEQGG